MAEYEVLVRVIDEDEVVSGWEQRGAGVGIVRSRLRAGVRVQRTDGEQDGSLRVQRAKVGDGAAEVEPLRDMGVQHVLFVHVQQRWGDKSGGVMAVRAAGGERERRRVARARR
ncbi:hypothetical protein FGB62_3g335 [Gracilaria domingensis]|nr:hypothetical protein FGB62_3g335 [Gracilaria domingensis]